MHFPTSQSQQVMRKATNGKNQQHPKPTLLNRNRLQSMATDRDIEKWV